MSKQDLEEIGREAMRNPALAKFNQAGPELRRLRTEMENAPMRPEDEAALTAAIEAVYEKRFPAE